MSAKLLRKTAQQEGRGSITWFWGVEGVKCATFDLRGCSVFSMKPVGFTDFFPQLETNYAAANIFYIFVLKQVAEEF
jgi:hypothetical protein